MNGQFEVVLVKLIAVLVQKYVVVCKKKNWFLFDKKYYSCSSIAQTWFILHHFAFCKISANP